MQLNKKNVPVVTIDGPTGSGKGTIGWLLAEHLGWHFLDSGILYRVLALVALQTNTAIDKRCTLETLACSLKVEFVNDETNNTQRVFYQGFDVTNAIRQEACGVYASQIAVLPEIRNFLLPCCQSFRREPGLVADGRDMGTVVFPDAKLKVYLTASEEARAQRRWQQLQNKGMSVSLRDVMIDLRERDKRDAERMVAPLKPAKDAIIVDATSMGVDDVLQVMLDLVKKSCDVITV